MLDLFIIGGGINGTGIARDAAGRGLAVALCEKDDLAAHTSGASSKLIHGGLRYLEHYEFRLVAEALSERETLLKIAPHLVHPLQFVMPHAPELRPAWIMRTGLFLYDHLGKRSTLPGSRAIALAPDGYGENLRPQFDKGYLYSDCSVDDARLVIANARAAADLGAHIFTRTACVAARRTSDHWQLDLASAGDKKINIVTAKCLINAAGPWVKTLLDGPLHQPTQAAVKWIKGSHIIVPRLFPGPHAFILQNTDRRVVFMIPYESQFTLIGTTDVELDTLPDHPAITPEEINYLCHAVNRYLLTPVTADQIVWSYAGVRPLYDDGRSDPSAITRDYVLELDLAQPNAPLLSIFGGKITTYRRLAEAALKKLHPVFPNLPPPWTAQKPLPGGDIPHADFPSYLIELAQKYPALPATLLNGLARRHGTGIDPQLHAVTSLADLGRHFGDTLYAREVDYFVQNEWARTPEDILYRRTKCGLHISRENRETLAAYLASGS